MPTYEYACESCGNRFELRQSFDAKPRQKCTSCGKMAQRVLFAPPVVFKGSGFYKTDSRGSDSGVTDGSGDTTPSVPDLGAAGHGHSHGPGGHTHGPGGHSHDAPTPAASTDSSDKKSTSKKSDSTSAGAAAAS